MYSVFISDSGNLLIEQTSPVECEYYIYYGTFSKCQKFVEKYQGKFKTYDEFYKFLHKWCDDNKISFYGCSLSFNENCLK